MLQGVKYGGEVGVPRLPQHSGVWKVRNKVLQERTQAQIHGRVVKVRRNLKYALVTFPEIDDDY